MVKVSVIMPVYNCGDFLNESVESILNQTLSDLELICVDDGSTDNSLEILREYESQDSRVKIFALNHIGGGDARNFALKQVCGEYLYFIDADDVLDLNAFEDFYSIAKSKNLDFLIFKAKKHDVKTGKYFETDYYNMMNLSNFVKDEVFKFDDIGKLIFSINVTPWCKFYNTQFILNSDAKFKENSKFHDNKFFWEILFQAERIFFLDKFYYTQNIHSDSLIESGGKSHIDAIPVSNDTIDVFIKYNQFDKFKVNLFNSKVYHTIRRYDEIRGEFKELYFTELKKDFKLLKCSDFRNNLYSGNKFLFDCVLIAKNYEDFNHLKEFYEVFINNHLSLVEKIEKYKEWYGCLDDDYKQLFFDNPKSMNIYNYLVSVIVPTYNSESFIENTFDSLLMQTIGFEKLEVIFVDDASDDNTPQIIDELALKYENVVSFHLDKNSGAGGKPRDVGMDHATADYLMLLDSDDLFFEDACEFLHDEITTEDIDIVSGTITKDGENVNPGFWESILTDPEDNYQVRLNKIKEMVTDDFSLKINTIDDYESVIANFGFSSKIYRKSFLLNNNIYFPHSTVAEDSVFLLSALLNANGIKFINKLVYYYPQRMEDGNESISYKITKESMINRLNSYFKMFLISLEKNKSRIFKKYLLFGKLNYFINFHVLQCNLSISDLLDVLVHATPLFRLYVNYNPNLNIGTATLFKYIANKDYENALKEIHGDGIKNQKDIKVTVSDKFPKDSFVPKFNIFVLSQESWAEQMESEKPDLLLFKSHDEDEEIVNYCNDHNIQAVQWDEDSGNLNDILDSINFKYIPDLKHLVLFYRLTDLKELNDITNHFHSITYPFKHLKMITCEENLFLSNTILESDLANLDFNDDYYYCFADLDFEFDEGGFDRDYKKCIDLNKETVHAENQSD